jgi:hypothetical protein
MPRFALPLLIIALNKIVAMKIEILTDHLYLLSSSAVIISVRQNLYFQSNHYFKGITVWYGQERNL